MKQLFLFGGRLMWLTALLVCFSPAFAQTLQIKGTVRDAATGDPLTGATVAIKTMNLGAFTDAQGNFAFSGSWEAAQGQTLTISYTGYEAWTYEINGDTEPDLRLEVQLQSENFTTEDVVITATKGFEQSQSDLTVSVEVMKSKAIDLQAVPSVNQVINNIPGVDNQGGQINIRGSSGYAYGVGSRVMVTLDGLPLLTGDAGTANLDLIPVDNIAQIEVMKGASSVLYGSSALGGVINVITQDPGAKPRTSVRVRGGIFDQPANPALDWDGDANPWSFSAHLFHSRRFESEQAGSLDFTLQSNFIKESGYRQGTDTEEYRNVLMLKYRPKAVPGLTIGLNGSLSVDSSASILYWHSYYPGMLLGPDGDSVMSGGGLTPTLDAGGYRRQLVTVMALDPSVKYLTPSGNSLFWYRGRLLRNRNVNNTNQSSDNSIFYHDFLYQRMLGKNINWVSGVTYSHASVQGDSLFGGTYVFEGDTIASAGRHSGNSLGVYTQLDGKFGRLNVNLGLRYERAQIDSNPVEDQPILRAGLNYKIAEGTNVRASFGQAFRVPSVAERFANTSGGGVVIEPNPLIESERGYSAELAFRQGFKSTGGKVKWKGFVDLAAFTMRYDNMVEFGVSQVGFTPDLQLDVRFSSINLADARINGAELTGLVAADWGKGFFSLSGGLTYLDPVDLNAVPDSLQLDLVNFPVDILNPDKIDRPEFLKYRSRWTGRVSASVGYDRFSLTANYRLKSFVVNIDQYLFLPNIVKDLADFRENHPGPDQVVDLILSADIHKNGQLSFTLDNAFNAEYMIIPGFLAPQRKLTLQYLIKF
ncbi:MAG: TonB-dependent receptor, partial [Bacteroidota bacterium]